MASECDLVQDRKIRVHRRRSKLGPPLMAAQHRVLSRCTSDWLSGLRVVLRIRLDFTHDPITGFAYWSTAQLMSNTQKAGPANQAVVIY